MEYEADKIKSLSDLPREYHFAFTLNVSCYFWSVLFNVDVNYSYILSFIEVAT